ncbi:hypothetical protein [Paenibacillus sp. 1P07SE]|uniref:hypothetical protein n=1 Tax=Paenibacillus sp. 1P07SE TaxID=3132209 RepID=UPI0039A50AB9
MLNLLRMDLRRFVRNRLTLILLLVYCVFHMFAIFMMSQYPTAPVQGMAIDEMTEGQFLQYITSSAPSWVLIYLSVFTVYFYMSEYQAGFYKNYMSMRRARVYSVLAKLAVQGVFTMLLLAAVVFSDMASRWWFFNNTEFGELGLFLRVLGVQFVLHWGFTALVLCLTILVRSLLTAVIAGIVLSFNLIGMGLAVLESLAGLPHISSYLLVNSIVTYSDYSDNGHALHGIAVGVVALVLFTVVSIRLKMKEDLR